MPSPDKQNYIAKQAVGRSNMAPYERILGEGLRRFLHELTMVNGAVMVSYICNNQHSSIDDIVTSSSECAVRPDRLSYAHHARIDFDWGTAPIVVLGMELQDPTLTVFFEVVLDEKEIGVDIKGVHFVEPLGPAEENLRRFATAVFGARLPHGEAAPAG